MPDTAAPPPPVRPTRVVLYVDDSTHWHGPAKLVSRYARHVDGVVTVVSCALMSGTRRRVLQHARDVLGLPEDRVQTVGRVGLVEYVLPDVARETGADVVVVGRLGSADRLTNGLIAHLVVKRTKASVLIARGKPDHVGSILMCTEGSRYGLANFERASLVAKAFGARLVALHVRSQMSLTAGATATPPGGDAAFLASDDPVAVHLRALKDEMERRGIDGDVKVRDGLVVDEILDEMREGGHDLLVIGAHDVHPRDALLYEDFASTILRASHVATLVVRDPSRR